MHNKARIGKAWRLVDGAYYNVFNAGRGGQRWTTRCVISEHDTKADALVALDERRLGR
jgi:hypothetical protein